MNRSTVKKLILQRLSRQFRIALLLVFGSIVLVLVVNFFVLLAHTSNVGLLAKPLFLIVFHIQFRFVHMTAGFTGISPQFASKCGITGQLTCRLSRR
jgi:hypothetical protein